MFNKKFDAIKRQWVECDDLGKVDGIPVITTTLVRVFREMSPQDIAQKYKVPIEKAIEWHKAAKKCYLELFDSRTKYKALEVCGFEDEAGMERIAVRHEDCVLPPDAIKRLIELEKKRAAMGVKKIKLA